MRESITFETNSLLLREFKHNDYEALFTLTRQPEITDIVPDWKMTEEQMNSFLKFVISSYEQFNPDDGRVLLAVQLKLDGQLIGWCGVFPNGKLAPDDREVAYAISKDYRNKGYITEAVQGMVAYVFEHSNLQQIVAIVKPFNAASRKVLEKSGFQHVRNIILSDGHDYHFLTRGRD
jgi:[ribosomal protein S5]-alanine N-acetyltransferase